MRAMELCQRPGINWEKTWSAVRGVYLVHLFRPDLRKACILASELVAQAEEHGSVEHSAAAENALATVRMFSGDFELAAQGFDREWALLKSIAKSATGLIHRRPALASQADNSASPAARGSNKQPHGLGMEPMVSGVPLSRVGTG